MPAASGGARVSTRPVAFGEGDGVAALKALVIGMGVLIVAGTVTLVVLIVQRSGAPVAGRVASASLGEPEGSRIGGIAATAGAVAIWVVRPDGDRVVLVDPASGRRTGEVRLRD
jgi:hypothetical protein